MPLVVSPAPLVGRSPDRFRARALLRRRGRRGPRDRPRSLRANSPVGARAEAAVALDAGLARCTSLRDHPAPIGAHHAAQQSIPSPNASPRLAGARRAGVCCLSREPASPAGAARAASPSGTTRSRDLSPPAQADSAIPAAINHAGPTPSGKKPRPRLKPKCTSSAFTRRSIALGMSRNACTSMCDRPPNRIVLVLTAYKAVDWHVSLGRGARVKKVIMSGYFEQEIRGLRAGIPVENRSYFPIDGSRRKEGWFCAHQWNTLDWRQMARRLNEMTGLAVTSFQGANQGDSFIVDGKVGREFGQAGLSRATARKPAPQDLREASKNCRLARTGNLSSGQPESRRARRR